MSDELNDSRVDSVRLFCPAKVNLGLEIVGRREDGYHLLQSLFWPLDFGDDLTLTPSRTRELVASWHPDAPFSNGAIPLGEDNLVCRAWTSLAESFRIELRKRIPMGAGLGGGSSDVGTLLRFFGQRDLDLAAQLGADVPFFLDPRPSWCTGTGELCQPLALKPEDDPLVFGLVFLPAFLSTPQVFQAFAESGLSFAKEKPTLPVNTIETLAEHLATTQNMLESKSVDKVPLLSKVLKYLRKTDCLYAGMSGSGPTCVAVYRDLDAAETFKALEERFRLDNCRTTLASTHRPLDVSASSPEQKHQMDSLLQGEHHGNHRGESFSR